MLLETLIMVGGGALAMGVIGKITLNTDQQKSLDRAAGNAAEHIGRETGQILNQRLKSRQRLQGE